jgi:hypothetical protein
VFSLWNGACLKAPVEDSAMTAISMTQSNASPLQFNFIQLCGLIAYEDAIETDRHQRLSTVRLWVLN